MSLLLHYIQYTRRKNLPALLPPGQNAQHRHLLMDEQTQRSLELFASTATGLPRGSLFHILDETVTPGGTRLLRERLAQPLASRHDIEARLDVVELGVRNRVLGIQMFLWVAFNFF